MGTVLFRVLDRATVVDLVTDRVTRGGGCGTEEERLGANAGAMVRDGLVAALPPCRAILKV